MIKIRKAEINDIDNIIKFQICMAKETEQLDLDKHIVYKGVKAVLNDIGKGQYFISEHNNDVIGSLLVTYEWSDWRNGQVWWIQSLYVVPNFRKKGVFKQMYLYLKEKVSKDDDLKGLRLYVDKTNKIAHDVYQSIGMNGEHYQVFEWMK